MTRRAVIAGLTGGAVAMPVAAEAQDKDDQMVLFDTAAHFDTVRQMWVVPLHAWVFRPQDSSVRKAAIAALFRRRYGLVIEPENQRRFDERINLLLADNKRARSPLVEISGRGPVVMPPSGPNGHTREFALLAPVPSTRRVGLAVRPKVVAACHLVPPEGVSVICDIDDTVKETGVLERKRLWESTFFKPFTAVAGMASLLTRLVGADGAVHYVSSSPWHLYPPLRSWLADAGFPVSSLHLKHIRLKDSTILDITKSPIETKPPIIAGILKRWPKRRFILIGDSGEKDAEVYAAAARAHPGQITRILIRRVPGDPSLPSRFDGVFEGLPRPLWQVFDDPADVNFG